MAHETAHANGSVHHAPTNRVTRLLDSESALLSVQLVRPPRRSRQVSRILLFLFLVSPIVLMFVPWQQSIQGSGQVVAFDPTDRPQEISAQINGRIVKWHVVEGSRVEEGDRIVEMVDNDPLFLQRLEDQLESEETKLVAYNDRVALLQTRVELQEEAKRRAVEAAESHLEMAKARVLQAQQELSAAQASLERDKFYREMQRDLERQGLTPMNERVLADRDHAQSLARVEAARAAIRASEQDVEAREADLRRVEPQQDAEIRAAQGQLRSAEGDVQAIQQAILSLGSQIEQQRRQDVYAPKDGIIFRILANQTLNAQVSKGEPLVLLVPDVASRVAEVYVDGNDAPLVQEGDNVRLQFEGWPAVQFVGWPSVAVGTFGGQVILVDATSDQRNQFRVLVEPYVGPGDEPWPSPRWLRQGVRVKGFILLNRVSLGYEIWRRLNGFPPVISMDEPGPEKIKVKRPK